MGDTPKELTGPEKVIKLTLELNEAKNKARLMASLHVKEVCELHEFRNKVAELLEIDTRGQEWHELSDREKQDEIIRTLERVIALLNLPPVT